MFDLIIIGAGPAGLSAAVYALRYSLKTLVLGMVPGGKIAETVKIENWLGEQSISGMELGKKMLAHAKGLGVEYEAKKVKSLKSKVKSNGFEVVCEGGEKFAGRAALIATGTSHRKLGVPGEKELTGRGVSYCSTCDAAFFKDKVVAVVGGGDSGLLGALNLADVAKKVYLIHRRSEFRAKPDFVKNTRENSKIELVLEREVVEVLSRSDNRLRFVRHPEFSSGSLPSGPSRFRVEPGMTNEGNDIVGGAVLSGDYKGQKILKVNGIFIEIGSEPDQTFSKQLGLETDPRGYIKTYVNQSTNVPGIFAAGDITTGSNHMQQIVTAAAEGAIAAESIYRYLKS